MKNLKPKQMFVMIAMVIVSLGFWSCSDDNSGDDPDAGEGEKTAMEFTLPDFSESLVYLVKDAKSVLAEVCNEYIPTFSESKRATVVYPYDKDGKVDHKNGFVADNGGRISWKDDGTYTYTPGTATPLTKLYVDSCVILAKAESGQTGMVQADVVKDPDGNVYPVVKIGKQYWLGKNYKSTSYNDGTKVPEGPASFEWGDLMTNAYIVYVPQPEYVIDEETEEITYLPLPEDIDTPAKVKAAYGLLYNGYAATDRKLAPAGWHLPSQAEWKMLATYLNEFKPSDSDTEWPIGGMLKEEGLTHWVSATDWNDQDEEVEIGNVGATNVTGFTAVGSGFRMVPFMNLKKEGSWWSTTPGNWDGTLFYGAVGNDDILFEMFDAGLTDGRSVRFLRD